MDHVLDKAYKVEEVIFFKAKGAFRLHVDSANGEDNLYKVIIFPLKISGPSSTVIFDNHWYGPSGKFSKKEIPQYEYTLNLGTEKIYIPDMREYKTNDPKIRALLDELIAKRKKVDGRHYDYSKIKNLNDQKPVKIKHLLSMSSGLEWLENYKRPISVTAKAYYGNNIKNLMFERNFVSNPGEFFKYQSGDTQLLGVLLERAVGESVSSYAGRKVWSKIGATKNALWSLDAKEGMEKTFCCFNSTARDFAKIGLVMLGGGEINDSVVISPEYFNWLFETPVLKMGNKRSRHFDKLINHYSNSWYIAKIMGKDVFYARGFLGQYIVVVPSLNLVFVRLGQKENPSSSENNEYLLTDNLKFFIEQVILDFNN